MDELRVDWGSVWRRHFHVVVDMATSYLWAKEFNIMSTDNSVDHLKEIMGVFGRALSIGGGGTLDPATELLMRGSLGRWGYLWNMGASTTLHPRGFAPRTV